MTLLIAISGTGGGNRGPQGIYQLLGQQTNILPIDTFPGEVDKNVEKVRQISLDQFKAYENIIFMGHSMGGAVAVRAASEVNKLAPGRVKGIVLLSTQTEGLQILKDLAIPVLFYHGQEDEIFPSWQMKTPYNRCAGPKRMVLLEGLDHDLGRKGKSKEYAHDLAKDVLSEMNNFFADPKAEIITRQVHLTPKKGFFGCITAIFSKN